MAKGRKPVGPKGPYPNRILILRESRNLTQAQLGDMIGVEGPYLGKLERGQVAISAKLLPKLCDALGYRPWEIVPDRFQISEEDIEALTINRMLSELDPERRERWIGAGEDALKAAGKI